MRRYIQLRIFRLIRSEGPIKPVAIRDRLHISECSCWQAIRRLKADGKVKRVHKARYVAVRGALEPVDGRGLHPASTRALRAHTRARWAIPLDRPSIRAGDWSGLGG